MTAGDSQSQRGSETESGRAYEKLKKKEEEEDVSGISRARHPRMNRQFRTANNGKVAICRPFVPLFLLSPLTALEYIYI